MNATFLSWLLLVIAAHMYDCTRTKHNHVKSLFERRQMLVKSIISKMTDLTLHSFLNTSEKDTEAVMKRIRDTMKSASKFKGPRGDIYADVVIDGIKSIVRSQNKFGEIEAANAIDSDIPLIKNDLPNFNKNNTNDELNPAEIIAGYYKKKCDCSCVEEKLCLNISSMDTFTCRKDQKEIPLAKLCDGDNDCVDKTDEQECRRHANEKLSYAKRIINEIENILPKHCLEVQNSVDKVIMKIRKETLARVLKKQTEFLAAVEPIKLQPRGKKLAKEVREIAQAVKSVRAALEGALCIRDKYKKTIISRRDGLSVDDNVNDIEVVRQRPWAPPLCTCSEQFCVDNTSKCSPVCNDTCWQRFSLGRWGCQTVSGARAVLIDHVCDGKADCVDESDEKGCTAGAGGDKVAATQMYNMVLEGLSSKIATDRNINRVANLQNAVKHLQSQSITERPDSTKVRHWRDKAISELHAIHEGILSKAVTITEVENGYNSLKAINQCLMEAMKRSNTGAKRLTPSARVHPEECPCMDDKCLLKDCSVACVRSCAVHSIFTKYSCKGNSSSRILLQNICNGKKDCPHGDDELICTPEVCRNHHLLLLRDRIKNHKHDRWGHALAIVLDSWKTKTMSSIQSVEKGKRSTRPDIQKLVSETLTELVQAYVTLPKLTKRSTEGSKEAFKELAQLLQDSFRSCTL